MMDTTTDTAQTLSADVTLSAAPRQGIVARAVRRVRNYFGGVFATLAILVLGVPSAAHAAAPAPPVVGDIVAESAGQLSNGIVTGFVDILPYVIPVLVIFTVTGFVWKMLSAKKKPT